MAALLCACGPAREPSAPAVAASASATASSVAALPPVVVPAASDVRLSKDVTPLRYALELRVDPRREDFEGTARIDVALTAKTRHVVLHGRELTIARAEAVVAGQRLAAKTSTRRALGGRQADEELVLTFERELAVGLATIEIAYSAPFAKLKGLYRVHEGDAWYAFTQLEAVDARRMFPAFDEPRFKTPFALRISVPKGMKAFANTAEQRVEPDGELERHVFADTLPLPTYLIAIAVGELDVIEGEKTPVPIRLIATKGRAKLGTEAMAAAADFLRILGAYFDRPYPYGKLDLVAVPDFGPGAMENAGLVTFREELLLVDGANASLPMKRRMATVTAHELAHQWFGDLVTMAWWDDIWLNEGFATWMAAKVCDQWKPGFEGAAELTVGKFAAMSADMLPSARPVRIPIETSDAILESGGWSAYQKGGSVLGMLEGWVGEVAFRDGLRAYVKAHEHGTVTSADLLDALDRATGKPLSTIARSFLDQPGVPLVSVDTPCRDGAATRGGPIQLGQSPLEAFPNPRKEAAKIWTIPVCLSFDGEATACELLSGRSGQHAMVACRASYPNASERGYYRFETPHLEQLGKVLRKHPSIERLGYLSDTWALVQAGRLDADVVLAALQATLEKETLRVGVEHAIGIAYGVRDALVDEAHAPKFRAAIARWLGPRGRKLGWVTKPGETDEQRLLRLAVLAALWDLAGDAAVARAAEPLAVAYLKDPGSVERDLGPIALRISAARGGAATFDALHGKLATALPFDRTVLVGALGSLREPRDLQAVLELTLSGEIHAGDVRYVYVGMSRQPASRALFSLWAREHFAELQKRLGSVGWLAGTIGWECDPASQSRVAQFYQQKLSSVEGMQRSFDEGLAQSQLCVQVRSRQLAQASAWLEHAR